MLNLVFTVIEIFNKKRCSRKIRNQDKVRLQWNLNTMTFNISLSSRFSSGQPANDHAGSEPYRQCSLHSLKYETQGPLFYQIAFYYRISQPIQLTSKFNVLEERWRVGALVPTTPRLGRICHEGHPTINSASLLLFTFNIFTFTSCNSSFTS